MDPDKWNPDTDPDPAFQVNPYPDPGFLLSKTEQKIQQKIYDWVISALLDPDPGRRDPNESGSNPDTGPQHWFAEPDT